MDRILLDQQLQQTSALRSQGRLEEALALALQLHAAVPDDPHINYQCAWTYDVMGLEENAVPFYERALALGLSGVDRRGALLGLGSTYRNIGEHNKSAAILWQGIAEYEDGREFQIFLAITLYDMGEHAEAMRLLLRNLAETTQNETLKQYERALLFYAANLNSKP